jgi:hypothetical protein
MLQKLFLSSALSEGSFCIKREAFDVTVSSSTNLQDSSELSESHMEGKEKLRLELGHGPEA